MTESGWVIEHRESDPSAPLYLTVYSERWDWTKNHMLAIRFAREVDARIVAEVIHGRAHSHRFCEHQWG
jgi:hypothetical protein